MGADILITELIDTLWNVNKATTEAATTEEKN